MTTGYTKTAIATLAELKANLRLSGTSFDTDLQAKLDAAIAAASNYIGRDLGMVEVYSGTYKEKQEIDIPTAFAVSTVSVNNVALNANNWIYVGKTLKITGTYSETDTMVVTTAFCADIKAAVILMASAMFTNPVDSVEQLPKASQNLLRPYRRYAGKRN